MALETARDLACSSLPWKTMIGGGVGRGIVIGLVVIFEAVGAEVIQATLGFLDQFFVGGPFQCFLPGGEGLVGVAEAVFDVAEA